MHTGSLAVKCACLLLSCTACGDVALSTSVSSSLPPLLLFLFLSSSFVLFAHVLDCVGCSALTCKAAVDNALAETEAHREAHRQKERDLQIQTQASDQAAEQIPSMRYHYSPNAALLHHRQP